MNPLTYLEQLDLRPLPADAAALLHQLHAPPRLVAHGVLVHDVAQQLTNALLLRWPRLAIDRDHVAFGAAIHDIGKIQYPEELIGPGHMHEAAGQALLIGAGINEQLARFCVTHAAWRKALTLEDLLVAIADTCWKGSRQAALEQQVINCLQAQFPEQAWETMLFVDQLVEDLATQADQRLAWQAQFPVIATS